MTYFCIVFIRSCRPLYACKISSLQLQPFQRYDGDPKFDSRSPPRLCGDQDPRVTQCLVGPQDCSPQTASWSVQSFSHSEAELSHVTDTVHIGNNRLHLCIQCSLVILASNNISVHASTQANCTQVLTTHTKVKFDFIIKTTTAKWNETFCLLIMTKINNNTAWQHTYEVKCYQTSAHGCCRFIS